MYSTQGGIRERRECGPDCVTTWCSAGLSASSAWMLRGGTNPISCNGVKGHCSLRQNCCGQLPEPETLSYKAHRNQSACQQLYYILVTRGLRVCVCVCVCVCDCAQHKSNQPCQLEKNGAVKVMILSYMLAW